MDLLNWFVFVSVAIFIVLTPGPGVLLAISNGAKFGVRSALMASLGNAIGLFLVSSATMIGLGALLKSSIVIFTGLKIVGAFYLIYLGIRQWKSKNNIFTEANTVSFSEEPTSKKLLLQGLCLAPTNPKAILFFTALFPQFIKTTQPIMGQFFILTFTFIILSVMSHWIYAYVGQHAKGWFTSNARTNIFNRFSGAIFMFFGVSMLSLKSSA
ncbi:MAG: LysE family translocator [Pseudomonadota bacterium]